MCEGVLAQECVCVCVCSCIYVYLRTYVSYMCGKERNLNINGVLLFTFPLPKASIVCKRKEFSLENFSLYYISK